MTQPRDPDLERAAQEAAESQRRAEREAQNARERSGFLLTLRRTLREMREENGFGRLLNDAFGGRSRE